MKNQFLPLILSFMRKYWEGLLLVLIFCLYLYLAISGITWGLSFGRYNASYHPDESIYLTLWSNMDMSHLDFNPHWFNKGTMHFYLVGAYLKIVSLLKLIILTPDKSFYQKHPAELAKIYLAGRFLTVIFGLGTLWIVYVLARKFYGPRAGIISAFLCAITPAFVINSHYMKPDVPVTFWIFLSVLTLCKLQQSGWSLKNIILTGVFTGFAIGTKYSAVSLIPLICWVCFISRNELRKAFWIIVGVAIFAFLIVNPYIILAWHEFVEGGVNHLLRLQSSSFPDSEPYSALGYFIKVIFPYGFGLPLFLLYIVGMAYYLVKSSRNKSILLIFILFYLTIMLNINWYFLRYILPLVPALAIVTSCVLIDIFNRISLRSKGRTAKVLFLSSILLIVSCTLIYNHAFLKLMKEKPVQEKARDWIIENITKETEIALIDPYFYTPPIAKDGYKTLTVGLDWSKLMTSESRYVIVSDYEYRNYFRLKGSYPYSQKFFKALFDGNDFILVKTFENLPTIFGVKLKKGYPPQDWMYTYPTILIFKRKKNA